MSNITDDGCVSLISGSGVGTKVHVRSREFVAASMPFKKRVKDVLHDCSNAKQKIPIKPTTDCPGELIQDLTLQVMRPAMTLTMGQVRAASNNAPVTLVEGTHRVEVTSAGIDTEEGYVDTGMCPVDQEKLCQAALIHQEIIDAAKDYLRKVHVEDMRKVFKPFMKKNARVIDPKEKFTPGDGTNPGSWPVDNTPENAKYLHLSSHLKILFNMMMSDEDDVGLHNSLLIGYVDIFTTLSTFDQFMSGYQGYTMVDTSTTNANATATFTHWGEGTFLSHLVKAALYLTAVEYDGFRGDMRTGGVTTTNVVTSDELRISPRDSMKKMMKSLAPQEFNRDYEYGQPWKFGNDSTTGNYINREKIQAQHARYIGYVNSLKSFEYAPLFATAFTMTILSGYYKVPSHRGLKGQGACFPVYEPRYYNNWVDTCYKNYSITPLGSKGRNEIQNFNGIVERVYHVEDVQSSGMSGIIESEEHYKTGNYYPPRLHKKEERHDHTRQCFDIRHRQSVSVPGRSFMKDIHAGLHHGYTINMFDSLQMNVTIEDKDFNNCRFIQGARKTDIIFEGSLKPSFEVVTLDVLHGIDSGTYGLGSGVEGEYRGEEPTVGFTALAQSTTALENEKLASRYWEVEDAPFKGCLMFPTRSQTGGPYDKVTVYSGLQICFGQRGKVPGSGADTQHQMSGVMNQTNETIDLYQGDECPGSIEAKDFELHGLIEGVLCPELGKQFSELVNNKKDMEMDVSYGSSKGIFSQKFNYHMQYSTQTSILSNTSSDFKIVAPRPVGECIHALCEGPSGVSRIRANPCPWDQFNLYSHIKAASVSGGANCNPILGRLHSNCEVEIFDKIKAEFSDEDLFYYPHTDLRPAYYNPVFWYSDSLQINPYATIHRLQCQGHTNFPGMARSIRINLGRIPKNLEIMEQGIGMMDKREFIIGLKLKYKDFNPTRSINHSVHYVVKSREEVMFSRYADGTKDLSLVTDA